MDPKFVLQPRAGAGLKRIDLNADAGEGYDDAGLLQYVSSVNIACGGHVGPPDVNTARTVELAARCGAGIGAHPASRKRFGTLAGGWATGQRLPAFQRRV